MKRGFKIILGALVVIATVALTAMYISSHNIAVLEPKGIIGSKERDLIYTSALLMLIVVIPVFIFTWIFAWKYREGKDARHDPDWEHNNIAECCWWGVPLVIIIILAVITWKSSHELNPFKPLKNGKQPIEVQVVALQWRWLFIYPKEGIATINWVQFPVETPLNFEITADAPMNSFWIPQLGGQIYAMPAMRSKLHLIANHVGTFRGSSANISGSGFANMFFTAKATTEEEYYEWVSSVKSSGRNLDFQTYEDLVPPTENRSVVYFNLSDANLFDRVLMKYEPPQKNEKKE